ncbi:hypothetical protein M595_0321 [Lyngbya aestuarii BL J]|uniref:Uncharacterized protein n=1 Tax=Lyngbya aestuarii BL J TaxID=1348334 RepID=U7QQN4_9CYAN|nr:hypothetical protein M595_0321 [Lyngbya aestuarii BL J]
MDAIITLALNSNSPKKLSLGVQYPPRLSRNQWGKSQITPP